MTKAKADDNVDFSKLPVSAEGQAALASAGLAEAPAAAPPADAAPAAPGVLSVKVEGNVRTEEMNNGLTVVTKLNPDAPQKSAR